MSFHSKVIQINLVMFSVTLVLRQNMPKLLFLVTSLKQVVVLNLFIVIFLEDIRFHPTHGEKISHMDDYSRAIWILLI